MAALQKDYEAVWILLERQRKKQRNTNYHSFEPYSMPYSELQHQLADRHKNFDCIVLAFNGDHGLLFHVYL